MSEFSVWGAVALGGACGALVRGLVFRGQYIIDRTRARISDSRTPYRPELATLWVNIAGSLLLGLLSSGMGERAADDPVRFFWMTGFCGSLTTFSTFCADALRLRQGGSRHATVGYLLAQGVLSLIGFSLGFALGA